MDQEENNVGNTGTKAVFLIVLRAGNTKIEKKNSREQRNTWKILLGTREHGPLEGPQQAPLDHGSDHLT